jgi:lipid-binding SYLF domain-containing protein
MQKLTVLLKTTAAMAIAAGALSGCTTTTSSTPPAPKPDSTAARIEIDQGVSDTLSRLYAQAGGTRDLVAKADGVLVFPRVLAAGLVVGGEYGRGALRARGTPLGYYRLMSLSVGFQAGAQSKAIIILFMTRDALDKFRASKGWTVGADASVAALRLGANGQIDTATATGPVQVIVMTNAGLMANLNLEGTKITPVDL